MQPDKLWNILLIKTRTVDEVNSDDQIDKIKKGISRRLALFKVTSIVRCHIRFKSY